MTITRRKKQFIAGYLITLAVLCLTYALMPFVPAVAWGVQEAHGNVRTEAFERAVSRYRVKQVAIARRGSVGVPVSELQESVPSSLAGDFATGVEESAESSSVDRQVIELLKTSSVSVAFDGMTEKNVKSAGATVGKSTVSTIRTVKDSVANAVSSESKPLSGIKVALAAPEKKTQRTDLQPKSNQMKPRGNSIVISPIKVDMPVLTGDESVLDRGAWLMPESANPGQGNTVISAHRYQSFGSKSFYHLDKIKAGDIVSVYWNGKEYRYRVTSNTVVKPDHVDALNKSSQPKLTLITCDPVFSTKNRRIVVAEIIAD